MNDSEPELNLELCAAAARVCACFNYRKASRSVTQMFDEMLQPTGLRSTQLVMLIAIAVARSATATRLARDLVMDRSTLTRNLRPLIREGLVQLQSGTDRRTRLIELTKAGRQALLAAIPYWERAQTDFVNRLGEERWGRLMEDLAATVAMTSGNQVA